MCKKDEEPFMKFKIDPVMRMMLQKCVKNVNLNRDECFSVCEHFNPVKINSIITTNLKKLRQYYIFVKE